MASNVTKVNISAVKDDDKANIDGGGEITLSNNPTNATIKVTAEDGTSIRNYNVTITKKESTQETADDVANYVGLKVDETYISGFTIGSSIQDNINNFKNKYPSAEVKLFNSSNEEITEGIISTGNKISIKVNGIEKKYDIVVYGDTNGDGEIQIGDYSKVKAHLKGKITMTGCYLEAADTTKDGEVQIGDYSKIKAFLKGKINNF